MNLWKNISTIGIKPDDNADYVRKAQLINQMCFISAMASTFFVPVLYFIDHPFYAQILLAASLFNYSYFILSKRRLYNTALTLTLFINLFTIFGGTFEIPGGGVEYFLIVLCFIPFVIYDSKKICYSFSALVVIAFFTSHFLRPYYSPHCIVSPFYTELYYIFIMSATFLLSIIIVLQFKISNTKYEQIIHQQKLMVEEKSKEIEEKNNDILDSIRYAKRIQNSLLPTKKYIERSLNRMNDKKS